MKDLRSAVSDPSLPVYEINENLSPLSGRIDVNLFFGLSNMIIEFQKVCEGVTPQDHIGQRFPAEKVLQMLNDHAATIENSADRYNVVTPTTPLREYAQPYVKVSGLIGSDRALTFFLDLFIGWISVERWFCDGISYADAVDNLRKPNKEEFEIPDLGFYGCCSTAFKLSTI